MPNILRSEKWLVNIFIRYISWEGYMGNIRVIASKAGSQELEIKADKILFSFEIYNHRVQNNH